MKLKTITSIYIFLAMLFASCQKDIDVFIPDTGQLTSADTSWVSTITASSPVSLLKRELSIQAELDSFNVSGPLAAATTLSGLRCSFAPNSFISANGAAVSGMAQTEMLLLKKKGDLIRADKPTQSNGRMLVSAGVVFLKVKQQNNTLSLAPSALAEIKFNDAAPNSNMRYFLGDGSNPMEFNWVLPTDSQRNRVYATNQEYKILTEHLTWINCDYFYDTTGIARTIVSASLPSNYTNANTEVFLVFKEIRSVLGMYGTPATKKFSTQKVPSGKPAYLVVISRQGNDYFFGTETIVTGGSGVSNPEHKVAVTPKKSSLSQIKAWLATL